MKILFISDVYFPRVNGVSTSIKTFMDDLLNQGHQIHLIAPRYFLNEDSLKHEKNITRISSKPIFFDPEDHLMKYSELMKTVDWIIKQKFDLIHIQTPFIAHFFGRKLSKLTGVPTVETYHTSFEDYLHLYLPWFPEILARKLSKLIAKKLCNSVDAVISPSKQMADILKEYGITKEIKVLPTGLPQQYFKKTESSIVAERYNLPKDKKILLYVGRVAHEKNIDFLLKAFKEITKKLSDYCLVITGEGPAEEHIHKMTSKLGLSKSVQFIGYLDKDTELLMIYQLADLFVFASKTETQGLVLLEAMAQGTPVVSIAELGTKSILENNMGAIISKDDPVDFATKCINVLSDKALYEKMSKEAIIYVKKNWSSSEIAANLSSYYQALVDCKLKKIKQESKHKNLHLFREL